MDSNEKLVDSLIERGVLKSKKIIKAFREIDRINFVLEESREYAYKDSPIFIGYNQTISQPTTVAFMLEILEVNLGEKVLDVGSGSGWTTALIANIVGNNGEVLGIEIIDDLVRFGKNNIKKIGLKNVKIEKSDKKFSTVNEKYDKILVSAEAKDIPKELLKKLKIGGVMVIPINNYICKVEKKGEEEVDIERYYGFVFVPLLYEE